MTEKIAKMGQDNTTSISYVNSNSLSYYRRNFTNTPHYTFSGDRSVVNNHRDWQKDVLKNMS